LIVLDSSAVLAVLLEEAGSDAVESALATATISSVNAAEVYAKAHLLGIAPDAARALFGERGIAVMPLSHDQAMEAGRLAPLTRRAGLSLGDRSCLALALEHRAEILTADRTWLQFAEPFGLTIRLIR
jgi:PIN domain nuclease of toxin-antitoxin system